MAGNSFSTRSLDKSQVTIDARLLQRHGQAYTDPKALFKGGKEVISDDEMKENAYAHATPSVPPAPISNA